jgi:hypothetical protein
MQEGGAAKFSAAFVITPEMQQEPWYKELQDAALKVGIAKFGASYPDKVRTGALKSGFRKDIENKAGYPAGSVYLSARSDSKPEVVDRYIDPATGKLRVITDPKELWAGLVVNASVNPYAYDQKVNKGVTFGLGNVQKWEDIGLRLDGRKSADEEFEGTLNEAPASLDDLT